MLDLIRIAPATFAALSLKQGWLVLKRENWLKIKKEQLENGKNRLKMVKTG